MEEKQTSVQERLSQGIDALNSGGAYYGDPETEELLQVARLIKQSGTADRVSLPRIEATVNALAAELSGCRRKRRRTWLLSGAAGSLAAACLVIVLNANLFMKEQPAPTEPAANRDLVQIVQIQREFTEPAAPVKQDAAVREQFGQSPADTSVQPAKPADEPKRQAEQKTDASKHMAGQSATASTGQAARQTTERRLAIAGHTAKSETVDAATGEVRQSYVTEAGEVTLVQGGKSKAAAILKAPAARAATAAESGAPETASTRTAEKDATAPAKENAGKVNKVTVTVDGVQATLEGEQPEEELKKIAQTIVKE